MLPIKETNSSVELLRESNEENLPLGTKNLNQNITKNYPPMEKKHTQNQKKENRNKQTKNPP